MRTPSWPWLTALLLLAAPSFGQQATPPVSGQRVVHVRAFLIDVDDISSVAQRFSATLYLELTWNDPALAHEGPTSRTLPASHPAVPDVKIVNAQRVLDTLGAEVEVLPSGDVRMRRRIWGHFAQPMDLADFPFDRQTLALQISATVPLETLRFEPDPENASGVGPELSVADWTVDGFRTVLTKLMDEPARRRFLNGHPPGTR